MTKSLIYKEILQCIKEGVYFVDTNRKITFWNNYAEEITGFSASEVLNSHCYDNILNHVDDAGTHLCIDGCPLHKTIDDSIRREASVYLHHKNGHRVPVVVRTFPMADKGKIIGAIELFAEKNTATELRHVMGDIEEFKILAMTDQLTGLSNRRYAENFLSNKLLELQEFQAPFAVALVDIDNFKTINDTYGHGMGDRILQMTSKSMMSAVRSDDLVVRWGGDEFLVIFSSIGSKNLEQVSERIRMLVESSSLLVDGNPIQVTVSVGSVIVDKPVSKDLIIQMADQLMYQSKQKGRNCISIG
ncbi:MAG: GGDEF domain-containing protein [Sphaerochaeta sp.]|nr:GGDEF domain-containing protein [Sphaerochaeta sp.]